MNEEVLDLKRPIIEACIRSAQKNGWSDAMGLLRGTLFLESEPMSLDTLAERTGYSKTTVRSSMNCLENLGIARRVVSRARQHRNKQYLYALVNDAESMRPVILSAAKEEVHLILQALQQIEKNIEDTSTKDAEFEASLAKAIEFYEEMNRILELVGQFTSKELIEILESKKIKDSAKSSDR